MKNIIVPVDYSENSRNALTYAFEIAQLAGARIILFHAFYPIMSPPAAYDAMDVIKALEEGKTKALLEFGVLTKQDLNTRSSEEGKFDTVPLKAVARMGGSYEKILEAIATFEADLVIMGMQGGDAIAQALLGSTTISVMQASQVPVLAVPKGVHFDKFATIVFAVNLSKLHAQADLHFLSHFVQTFKANLQVLHLYKNEAQRDTFDTTQPLQHLTEQFKAIPYTINFDVQEDVARGIQNFIRTEKADLLVLIPQPHNMVARLLDKSVTGRITARPRVPLLALPASTLQPGKPDTLKQESEVKL
ncbi:universal stress protein [Pontibacter sp. Tf4]|uniref:universal stress protein n=1 Tax=Pontibacter sp. Tf4 TaxID=2761620 RepID=UPI00162718DC|nr:universal stress protein [Pontibacter sp. Tf4]MBB6611880.1 universal stress protein [Pontibacter sp. Tf4]